MQIVILCGGMASRWQNTSHFWAKSTPKSLIPVLRIPFLRWQLNLWNQVKPTGFLLCTGHLGDQIEDFLAKLPQKVQATLPTIEVSHESKPLGTAGALLEADKKGLLEEQFLVTYGDSFLTANLFALTEKLTNVLSTPGAQAVMSIFRDTETPRELLNVSYSFEDRNLSKIFYQKHGHAHATHLDYGVTAINRRTLRDWASQREQGPADLAWFFEDISKKSCLHGIEVTDRYYEIGTPQGLRRLEQYLCTVDSSFLTATALSTEAPKGQGPDQ